MIIKVPAFDTLEARWFLKVEEQKKILTDSEYHITFQKGSDIANSLKVGLKEIGFSLFLNLCSLSFAIFESESIYLFCGIIRTSTKLKSVAALVCCKNYPVEILYNSLQRSNVELLLFKFKEVGVLTMRQTYFLAELQQNLKYLICNDFLNALAIKLLKTRCEVVNRYDKFRILAIAPNYYAGINNQLINFLDQSMVSKLVIFTRYSPLEEQYIDLRERYKILKFGFVFNSKIIVE